MAVGSCQCRHVGQNVIIVPVVMHAGVSRATMVIAMPMGHARGHIALALAIAGFDVPECQVLCRMRHEKSIFVTVAATAGMS